MIMPDSDLQIIPNNDALNVNEYGSIHVPQAFVLNVSKGTEQQPLIEEALRNANSITGLAPQTASSEFTKRDGS